MIITRGFGVEDWIEVNFVKEAIGHLENEDNLHAELEEKADFVGVVPDLPDEYVGLLEDEEADVEGGLGHE